jgi:carboxypeptidase Q
MPMLGLGNSVATPADGITAEVLVVGSFEELERRAAEAAGRIVVFDVPFTSYGETVRYRAFGASAAARAGAVAALVRSVTPFSLQTPHTGMMIYEDGVPRIPTAAITVEDAQLLHRMQERGDTPRVTLRMAARSLPPAESRNVVAELRGREHPDEIVLVGGHIDSWDVGQSAMDNAGGAVASWEALRLLHRLGLQPRRTIRVVLWTDEEQGGRGARAYRDHYRAELDRHSVVIEADGGVFTPTGFGFTGSNAARATVNGIASLLATIDAADIGPRGGGADAAPLMQLGVPGMSLDVAGERYFWYHHSEADTIDKLDADEFNRCVAALAVMAYMIAELPELLPRR